MHSVFRAPLAALLLAMLGACGGGSSDGTAVAPPPPPPPPTGGIEGTGISVGPITGFGSVIISGKRYAVDARTTILVDDAPATQDDLQVGQIVRAVIKIPTAGGESRAERIEFEADLRGNVESVDLPASSFVVLGQTVRVDGATAFSPDLTNGLASLTAGLRVEVSGLRDSQDQLRATRVESEGPSGEVELRGTVSGLDVAASRFLIGTQVVSYGAAALPDGVPQNGDLVDIEGSIGAGGTLLATTVERESRRLNGDADDSGDVEGFITRFVSAADFDVAGQPVRASAATVYEGGTSAGLALDVKVEVEGAFDSGGVLVASEIEFKPNSSARAVSTVTTIDAAAGTFVVLGVTVETSAATAFEDNSDADQRPFNLGLLRTGDYVDVAGGETAGSRLAAVRVKRDDPDDVARLRGRATQVDAGQRSLRILGTDVTAVANAEFKDENDQPIDAATFFARAADRLVDAKGTASGGALLADELELETED